MEDYLSTNNQNQGFQQQPNFIPVNLPNATTVLILGIVSILACCCYGLGLIISIIGLILYNKDNKLYKQNPSMYSNYSTLNTGRILCIIGIVFSVLYFVYMFFIIQLFGLETLSDPEALQQAVEEYSRQLENQ